MSHLTYHVAEQPDILAADANWRKELSEIIKELTDNMPGIKRTLCLCVGNDRDAEILFDQSGTLMGILHKLEERQQAAVKELEQHQVAWKAAIDSRDGKLAKLDIQLVGQKQRMKEYDRTESELKEQTENTQRSLTSLTQQVSTAEAALKRTRAEDVLIKETRDTEKRRLDTLESRLKEQEEDLDKQENGHKAKIGAFDEEERRRREALASREEELDRLEQDLEATRTSQDKNLAERTAALEIRLVEIQAKENAAANLEVEIQQSKSRNDRESQKLRSALSILQSLANETGSEHDALSSLDNIQSLAASIRTRCKILHDSCSEKDRSVTDQQEHLGKVEASLESTTQELQTRNGLLETSMIELNDLKKRKFAKGKLQAELAACRQKLDGKTGEHDELMRRYATLDAYHQTCSGELAKAKGTLEEDQALLVGLQSYTVPKLEATENQLQSQVEQLTKENKQLRVGRIAGDKEIRELKVKDQGVEVTVRRLQAELQEAEQSRKVMQDSFNTLLNDKGTEASINYQSYQSSSRGLKDVKAINDSLNTSLRASNEKWQTAADEIVTLESENTRLRSRISDAEVDLGERNEKIQALELVAQNSETKSTTLESQCSQKDATIKRAEDVSRLAALENGARIAGLESDIEEKDAEIQALNKSTESLETEIRELNTTIHGLESEIEQKDVRIQASSKDKESLEAENRRLNTTIHGLESDIEQRDSSIKALNKEKESLEVESGTLNAIVDGLEEELATLRQEVEKEQGNVARLSTSLSEREAANQQLVHGLQEQLNAQNAEIVEAQATKRESAEENQRLSKSLQQLKAQISTANESLRTTADSNQKLTDQVNGAQRERDQLVTQLQGLRITEAEHVIMIHNLRSDLTEQEKEANTRDSDLLQRIDGLNSKVLGLENTVQRRNTRLTQLGQEKESLQAAADRSASEVDSLSMDLTDAQASIESLTATSHDNDFLIRRNVALQAAAHKCELEHSDPNRTLDEIRGSFEDVEEERDDLLAQVQSLKAQLESCRCTGPRSRKRTHNQIRSDGEEEEEASHTRHSERIARILGKVPESTAGPSVPRKPMEESTHPQALGSRLQGASDSAGLGIGGATKSLMSATTPGGLSATITPSNSVAFTFLIEDAKRLNFSSDTISNEILERLRTKFGAWNSKSGFNWTAAQTLGAGHSCIESRLTKKKSKWDNGLEYACVVCEQRMRLCMVVHSAERVLLLPRKAAETEGKGPLDTSYWRK